jgi:hypothetical protein
VEQNDLEFLVQATLDYKPEQDSENAVEIIYRIDHESDWTQLNVDLVRQEFIPNNVHKFLAKNAACASHIQFYFNKMKFPKSAHALSMIPRTTYYLSLNDTQIYLTSDVKMARENSQLLDVIGHWWSVIVHYHTNVRDLLKSEGIICHLDEQAMYWSFSSEHQAYEWYYFLQTGDLPLWSQFPAVLENSFFSYFMNEWSLAIKFWHEAKINIFPSIA